MHQKDCVGNRHRGYRDLVFGRSNILQAINGCELSGVSPPPFPPRRAYVR